MSHLACNECHRIVDVRREFGIQGYWIMAANATSVTCLICAPGQFGRRRQLHLERALPPPKKDDVAMPSPRAPTWMREDGLAAEMFPVVKKTDLYEDFRRRTAGRSKDAGNRDGRVYQ